MRRMPPNTMPLPGSMRVSADTNDGFRPASTVASDACCCRPLDSGGRHLCVLVFILQQVWPGDTYQALKFFSAAQWQQSWLDWRWLSPALLHFSAAHLMFNLLAWWLFAGRIEQLLGARTLILMSLSAALLSNCAQFLLQGEHFGGLSGVVYAVLGFSWIYGWRFPTQALRLSRWDIGLALLFLLLGFLDLLWVNTAKLGPFRVVYWQGWRLRYCSR